MQTKEKILRPIIERIKEKNRDIATGKEYSRIMENLGIEVIL